MYIYMDTRTYTHECNVVTYNCLGSAKFNFDNMYPVSPWRNTPARFLQAESKAGSQLEIGIVERKKS